MDYSTELEVSSGLFTGFQVMKIKVLLLAIHYPLAMKSYFERALRRRDDIDLITVGPYTNTWIPWLGGMNLPAKYAVVPDFALPFAPNIGMVNYEFVRALLPKDWHPDIVLTIDAGISWVYRPTEGMVMHVATDPHALNYDHARSISDKFFCMQKVYMQKDDIYLPYAYDPTVHYPMPDVIKDTDAVLIGMPYDQRVDWINRLRRNHMSVIFENGPVFDEYRQIANRARIGLNWSSLQDLNARAFEIPAMGLAPVMNYVPDLELFDFSKYVQVFRDTDEAVAKALWLKNNPDECNRLAQDAHRAVQPHTYDSRVESILTEFLNYG